MYFYRLGALLNMPLYTDLSQIEILDEVFRVCGGIGATQTENLQAVYHLWATSRLIDYLEEDYALYILAYSIRYLVRQPKTKNRLDPFPDEIE